jgi:putative transcriptional regulator
VKSLTELKEHLEGKRKLAVYRYDIPNPIDVRAIRVKTGLSQAEFAQRFAIGRRTLQDWEQGRRAPDATVRAYLTVIERNSQAVEDALSLR